MKGIAGNQTRGLQNGSQIDVVDNTGAKVIEIITVPGYHGVARRVPSAGVGDIVIASVKKGTPQMRRQIVFAVIVRQRRPMRRPDGTMIYFEDNAAVITHKTTNLDDIFNKKWIIRAKVHKSLKFMNPFL